ncbi:ankyrin repeat domain-containing protein [Maribacter sp. BPC-D8]|uniref:ankyrin repeat domain-containing protein n=1 Tax=Maribacter sp. BPC-D8 TaxID=3053613 RepID=UPI002B494124|nr:ankyrin repeat domain-containing protein [Maribacter sp. BPC-D8]WRI30991.1 ankyrin repeat domain-containing protein [Maribacter sp. BPC-D8]
MTLQELTLLIYENTISDLTVHKNNGVNFCTHDSYDKGNLLISYAGYGYQEHYTQTEMTNFLLECGFNIDDKLNARANGRSALHCAVANGHFEIVKVLIENGALVEIKDKNGNTPLWNAVMMCRGNEQQKEIIKYLVSKGSSVDTKNNHDLSPRDIINRIGEGIDNNQNKKEWDLRFLL